MKFRTPPCRTCDQHTIRLDAYDSYACRKCDTWRSELCKDAKCLYCSVRAKFAKPSMVPVEEWNNPWNTHPTKK